jgi:hypothetical protein
LGSRSGGLRITQPWQLFWILNCPDKKKTAEKKLASFSKLQAAFHENVVGLVEAFYDSKATYFVYNYYGFAVNLSQVTVPTAIAFHIEQHIEALLNPNHMIR